MPKGSRQRKWREREKPPMGRIKKIMFRAAHYKRFQLWDMCVSMCRPRPTFDWELCMEKMWESVRVSECEREMPIKDEQQANACII